MSTLESKLAELAGRFAARAPEEMAAIADALDSGDTGTIVDRAHKLAGIAGMFGHSSVSAAARALEEAGLTGQDCSQEAAVLLALLDGL